MSKIFKFLFFPSLFFVFLLGSYYYCQIYLPKDTSFQKEGLISIKRGETLSQIAEKLERKGLIKNKYFFILFSRLKRNSKKVQAGVYELASSMSISEILKKFILGETYKIKITFLEGEDLEEIEEKLKHFFPEINLKKYKIKDFKENFEFLKEVPDSASLEGFLFPDTYFFELNMKEKEIVEVFLKNLEKKLKKENLEKEMKKQGKNLYETLILASLVEKEVYNTKNCPDCKNLVAGILEKRLKARMPLQVDATLVYICKDCKGLNFSQMRRKIGKMKVIDSPYNTYKYLGLPPTPICNPGIESIRAVIYPKKSEFWYYLSTPKGETIFNKTLKGHNQAVREYLREGN